MRPPPAPASGQQAPPMGDHYHHHNPYLHQQQQPRLPAPPQGHQWYSNQFQYQPPPPPSHSPSPPPPPSQWAPPAPSPAYHPPPPPPPYPAHHYPLPPRPHVPPPPPPPQVSQSYSQPNQDWGNSNWSHHHQGWDYSAQNNAPDWAARAKEWANARAAMENQHIQSQYPQPADFRTEETAYQKEHVYGSLPMPIPSAQEGQPFTYGNQAADPPTVLSDQPLDFAPRFNHDQDLHMQSSYAAHHESAGTVRGIDPVAAVPSVNSWTPPVTPGVAYPPIPPAGSQHDHSIAMASVPGTMLDRFINLSHCEAID